MSCTFSVPPSYAIVLCPYCGFMSISMFSAKVHECPKCRRKFKLRPKKCRSRIVAPAWTAYEAREILQKFTGAKPQFYTGTEVERL